MMADVLDRLIADFSKGGASGRAGIFDDEDNASKLLWNEYGTETSPARPTLTPAYDEDAIFREIESGVDAILGGRGSAVKVVSDAVSTVADRAVRNIESNTPPPLAESTIAGRQSRGNASTATLIDTGEMRDAVRSEAKPGDDGWGD